MSVFSEESRERRESNQSWRGDCVGEIPFGNQFEKGVNSFIKASAKHLVSQIGSAISRGLAAGTEPFFRRDLGERHLTPQFIGYGQMLWFFSTVVSCLTGTLLALVPLIIPPYQAPPWAAPLLRLMSLPRWLNHYVLPLLAGGAVWWFYGFFCKENFLRIAQIRATGKKYHSRSRGQPRWNCPPEQLMAAQRAITVALFIFAPITGLAFAISLGVTANLMRKQEQAIYDRYWDAMDAQIEGEFMQDAITGKCPPEITYLYKPLPDTLSSEFREDVAAAFVGKPVKIVAQGPKRPGTAQAPGPSNPLSPHAATTPPTPVGTAGVPQQMPLPGAQLVQSIAATVSPALRRLTAVFRNPKLWMIVLWVSLLVALGVEAPALYRKFFASKPPPVVANSQPQIAPLPVKNVPQPPDATPPPAAIPAAKPVPEPAPVLVAAPVAVQTKAELVSQSVPAASSASSENQSAAQPAPPVAAASVETLQAPSANAPAPQVAMSKNNLKEAEPEEPKTVAPAVAQREPSEERYQMISKMQNIVSHQNEQHFQFRTNCDALLTQKLKSTSLLDRKRRNAVKELRTSVAKMLKEQADVLDEWEKRISSLSAVPLPALRQQLADLTTNSQAIVSKQEKVVNEIKALSIPERTGTGLIQIR